MINEYNTFHTSRKTVKSLSDLEHTDFLEFMREMKNETDFFLENLVKEIHKNTVPEHIELQRLKWVYEI